MPQHTAIPSISPEVTLAQHLRAHLKTFLAPLLQRLATTLDVRLVQTASLVVEALVRQRQRPQALWLTKIGTLLLGAAHAPAGVKRVARLLASPHRVAADVEQWLLAQADQFVAQESDVALVALDQSVLEKPESQAALGLCAVRSSKARRLARPRPGFGAAPPRPPVPVPGLHWLAATVMVWSGPALLAVCRWWSPRPSSPQPQRQRESEVSLLRDLVARWGRRVLFVWDRGFAGRPFLEVALAEGARFVVRWPKRNYLAPPDGEPTNAWRLTQGKRAWGGARLWDARRRCWLAARYLAVPVRLPGSAAPLWLVVSRGRAGAEPWRLLTNEPVETAEQAWRIIQAYGQHWQVECALRLGKSDWGMESCRQHYWERRAKLLALAFLAVSLLGLAGGDIARSGGAGPARGLSPHGAADTGCGRVRSIASMLPWPGSGRSICLLPWCALLLCKMRGVSCLPLHQRRRPTSQSPRRGTDQQNGPCPGNRTAFRGETLPAR